MPDEDGSFSPIPLVVRSLGISEQEVEKLLERELERAWSRHRTFVTLRSSIEWQKRENAQGGQ